MNWDSSFTFHLAVIALFRHQREAAGKHVMSLYARNLGLKKGNELLCSFTNKFSEKALFYRLLETKVKKINCSVVLLLKLFK